MILGRVEDLKKLADAVRQQLVRQLNLRLESRKTLLEDKIASFNASNTEEELAAWRTEIASLQRKILYNFKLPDNEIFTGNYNSISWNEISIKNVSFNFGIYFSNYIVSFILSV